MWGEIHLMTLEKEGNSIFLGLARCKNCNDKLQRLDNPFKGFCSEKCKKVFKGIRKIKAKDLHHIVFWYYLQRKNEYDNHTTNKRAYRSLKKLLNQLDEVFD